MEVTNPNENWNQPQAPQQENKKIAAGICALLIGGLGIHKFILGYNKEGIIQIIISVISCGTLSMIPFIEGIIYLTKSDSDFYQTYQVNKRGWF
ncbi:MAG: TM2 domain-containing protein [Flavobacterium sp.]|jgi:TM2 domain-containing membrane protein YozV